MALKTYFGFLIILLVKETVTEDPCIESLDAVAACKTVNDVKRQLFIPINNTIGDGCQCTVQLVSELESDKVESKFIDRNECGFNASIELNGESDTLTCNNALITIDMGTGDDMIFRFTGRSETNDTTCLQIVPQEGGSKIKISCADQITDLKSTPTTLSSPSTSSSSVPTSPSTTQATSQATPIPSPMPASSTSQALPSKPTAPSATSQASPSTSQSATHSSRTVGSSSSSPSTLGTTTKPNSDKTDISFIIILIVSCVAGFLIILLIILITWCVIYQRRKKRYEAKEALPYNETGQDSLEGIQVENELFILAYKDDEGKEGSKPTYANDNPGQSPNEWDVDQSDRLPDIITPSENGVKKVNFDVYEELPEESVTEFRTDTILMNDTSDNAITGRIQL